MGCGRIGLGVLIFKAQKPNTSMTKRLDSILHYCHSCLYDGLVIATKVAKAVAVRSSTATPKVSVDSAVNESRLFITSFVRIFASSCHCGFDFLAGSHAHIFRCHVAIFP